MWYPGPVTRRRAPVTDCAEMLYPQASPEASPEDETVYYPRSIHMYSNGRTAPSQKVFPGTFCNTLIEVTKRDANNLEYIQDCWMHYLLISAGTTRCVRTVLMVLSDCVECRASPHGAEYLTLFV